MFPQIGYRVVELPGNGLRIVRMLEEQARLPEEVAERRCIPDRTSSVSSLSLTGKRLLWEAQQDHDMREVDPGSDPGVD